MPRVVKFLELEITLVDARCWWWRGGRRNGDFMFDRDRISA